MQLAQVGRVGPSAAPGPQQASHRADMLTPLACAQSRRALAAPSAPGAARISLRRAVRAAPVVRRQLAARLQRLQVHCC